MSHVVLVGDSVFDNAAYVTGPDVGTLVEKAMPTDWNVSILAVDGSVIPDVPTQLQRLPGDVTLMVVSAGGNDALSQIDILNSPVGSVGEALLALDGVLGQFRQDYGQLLDEVLASGVRSYVCTIYRPRFPDAELQRVTSLALGLFNDVIIEEASERRIPIFDIRKIYTDGRDYSNEIEPSVEGGRKLAAAIAGLALELDPVTYNGSVIYP